MKDKKEEDMETANGVLKIRFEVKGVSPLLMNPMPEGVLLNLRDKKKKAKSAQATVTRERKRGQRCIKPLRESLTFPQNG